MSEVTLRPAGPSEAAALSALAQRAKAHWGYPAEWLAEWRPALTLTDEHFDRHVVVVAEQDGVVVGFASLLDAGRHCELAHLWVEPALHGHGIGRRLFAAATDLVRERGHPVLRIESDPFAAGFYERCGARRIGVVSAPVLGVARDLPLFEYAANTPPAGGTSRQQPPVG